MLYTYYHFAYGISAYFAGWTLAKWILIHTGFSIAENSPLGFKLMKKHLKFYKPYKTRPDSFKNIIGDFIAAITGWLSAKLIAHLFSHCFLS